MACTLVKVPNTRDFEARTGEAVTLITKDPDKVLIETADYAGDELVDEGHPVSSVELKVAPGPNQVNLVFVFEPGTDAGELHEDCGADSHLLRSLSHADPFKSFTIIGKP
jgi:hypothetical protein